MANFYADNDDLRFYVERGIDWEPLVRWTEILSPPDEAYASTDEALEVYTDILNLVGEFSADRIAPAARAIDEDPPRLEYGEVTFGEAQQGLFDELSAMGLHGLCVPRQLGGMNSPLMLYFITGEVMSRADVSVMAHHSFHGGIAMALLMYSVEEGTTDFDKETRELIGTRFGHAISEIVAGEAWGSMDITEPDAGSDMGALRCTGTLHDDGTWTVSGQKIFITSGHGKYHVVIALTEPASDAGMGLDGLSLFLVPAWTDNDDGSRTRTVTVERLEEKMGHHGSATVTVSYEDSPAHLLGQRGEGFKGMLLLMNNARIGVGFESLGLCEAAWRDAKAYAAQRPSMGKTIDQHEIIADYLEEMETDIQGIRALAVHAAWHEELATRQRLRLKFLVEPGSDEAEALEREVKRLKYKSRLVTPLLKFIAAEKAVEIARRNVQIHGGCGYMTEYDAERMLRDALVMPIYEGTTQIQALMATKDALLDVTKRPQRFVSRLLAAQRDAVLGKDPLERGVARVELAALSAQRLLMTRVAGDKLKGVPLHRWKAVLGGEWDPKRDFAYALLHAERLSTLLTDAAICRILLQQVKAFPDREDVLVRYLERAEPRSGFLLETIRKTGDRLLEKLARSGCEGDGESAEAAK